MSLVAVVPAAAQVPNGYVYLTDIDASIVQDIRYASAHNFIGRPARGYGYPACILTEPTAQALKRVQDRLRPDGLTLKVFDCYRPARAVRDFVQWSQDPWDEKMKREFYPLHNKADLFALGFLAEHSSHARGNAVDLAIARIDGPPQDAKTKGPLKPCHLPLPRRYDDGTLDFGTAYDCFHDYSSTAHPAIKGEARLNRDRLVAEMKAEGFKNYAREWWHFLLPGAGKDTADFPIRAKPQL
jgi:zinc D-Ala-D-Ala dipeptidase